MAGGRPTWQRTEWDRLVRDVHAGRRRRVVVSAEAFVEADEQVAREVVDGFGGDRVHVVVTLRPLARILPSAWQQNVRSRLTATYDEWLGNVLGEANEARRARNFWHRHRHDAVVERWMSVVGPKRAAVIVVDDDDRLALPRGFEQLLGLPAGFLVNPDTRDNRGLTAPETELVRELNQAFADRGWSDDLYHRVVRLGVVQRMQSRAPEPDEPRITTPAWAVERANHIAAAASAAIEASGALVLGDLATLSAVPVPPESAPQQVPGEMATGSAERALAGVRAELEGLATPPPLEGNARPIEAIPTGELAGVIGDRLSRRVRTTLGLGVRRY